MEKKLKLSLFGGTETVTGANFLLSDGETNVLVDCGMTQDKRYCHGCNYDPFPYDPSTIKTLFVTHAHMDHIGRVPKLVKDGFTGTIYATEPTIDLMKISLEDGARIVAMEAQKQAIEPLYTQEDVNRALALTKVISFEETVSVGDFSVKAISVGHILGAAGYLFHAGDKKIFFSGDLGNAPSLLIPDIVDEIEADYVVMESVYGNRTHIAKDLRRPQLVEKIQDAIKRGGAILIPSFSIARTQILLYELSNMMDAGEIPKIPVFLDSPLAIKVTDIYRKYTNYLRQDLQSENQVEGDIFGFNDLHETQHARDSQDIDSYPNPKIIIAGAGMSHGGRIQNHEMKHLKNKDTTILFSGYQVVGSLGRIIQDGAKKVRIGDRWTSVHAHVDTIKGYSAHRDVNGLVDFVSSIKGLKKVFIAMGEPDARAFLAQRIHDFVGTKTEIPKFGSDYEL